MITRTECSVFACGLVMIAAAGCGSKGPPLPPLRPVPGLPTELALSRVGGRVTLRVVAPSVSSEPATPLSISSIEVYARTLPMGSESPTREQLLTKEYRVATIPIRPPAPLDKSGSPIPPSPTAPPDVRPGPGELVVWSETIPTAAARPLELTRAQQARADARRTVWMPIPPTGISAPWFRFPPPTRYYVVVGVSARGRQGMPSAIAAVPFDTSPDAPASLNITWTESELKVQWTTPTPNAPVHVFETTRDGAEKPAPVQDQPITSGAWSTPVVFGVEKCFVVRGVRRRGAVTTGSATFGPTCETPKDTFGPAAPINLAPVLGTETVTLVWDAVSAADLAGYIVLRATGASETLQELTPKPIAALQFADTTVRAGQRYIYYVVAVDTAGNRGPRSAPVNVERFTFSGK